MSADLPKMLTTRREVLEESAKICPALVLTYNYRSFISWRIAQRTEHEYSHAMWLWWPEVVATQEWRFQAKHLDAYLDDNHRVKFWHNPLWTPETEILVHERLLADVTNAGKYDWLGIIGQLAASLAQIPGLTKINFPGRNYCSEEAGDVLTLAEPSFTKKHQSPAGLDLWCKSAPQMRAMVYDPTL